MLSTIPSVINSPPPTYSSPSPGEKASATRGSQSFEKALNKASKQQDKVERAPEEKETQPSEQEALQALYSAPAAPTPPPVQVENPPAQTSAESGGDSRSTMAAAALSVPAAQPSTTAATTVQAIPDVAVEGAEAQGTISQPTPAAQTTAPAVVPVVDEITVPQQPAPEEAAPVEDPPPVEEPAEGEPDTQEAAPVRITIRQHGTGAKNSFYLEGNPQPTEPQAGGETEPAAPLPQGVAYGLRADGVRGHSPVHMTELDRLAGARASEVVHQVTNHIEGMVNAPRATLHVQLNPEELGRIDLRLTTNAHGLRVTMIADQPLTREILESNLGSLKDALAQAGINLSSLNISQDSHPGQGHPGWQPPSHPGQPYPPVVPDEEQAAAPVERRTSAIDYRV